MRTALTPTLSVTVRGTLKGSRTPALWLRRAKPASANATGGRGQTSDGDSGREMAVRAKLFALAREAGEGWGEGPRHARSGDSVQAARLLARRCVALWRSSAMPT